MKNSKSDRLQIKICGLTDMDNAMGCAALGPDAIGFVFYPKSPRNVIQDRAREISMALPREIKTVGVFVNETFSNIMQKVEHCHLDAVQLHGQESPDLVSRLRDEGLVVIKALFTEKRPLLKEASDYEASAFLLECGKGVLPGGNAIPWQWEKAYGFGEKYPFILAGGLDPDNVFQAITVSLPDAVDVSSGVESAPGRKDLHKAELFINSVSQCDPGKKIF